MASSTVAIGSGGQWRIDVDLVSQNTSANTSVVRVRGTMINTTSVRSFNNNNVAKSVSGTNSWSSTSGGFDCPAGGSDEIINVTFTVTHNSAGNATVTYYASVGATGTTTFGSGGTASTSLALPRIPKVPGKMATPTRTFTAPSTVTIAFAAPSDNGGSAITKYQIHYDDNISFTSPTLVDNILSTPRAITGLGIGKTWSFKIRAVNAIGPGPWSDVISYAIPNVPGTMAAPTLTYTPPDTMDVAYSAPSSNGGASISGYDIRCSKDPTFATGVTTVTSTTLSKTITDLEIGFMWYFQVRAKNSQGPGAWSPSALYLVVCGPRIKVGGVWKNTVLYVKVGGVWKVATPYVKVGGVWKIAGG